MVVVPVQLSEPVTASFDQVLSGRLAPGQDRDITNAPVERARKARSCSWPSPATTPPPAPVTWAPIAPAHRVGDVLRRDRVQPLTAHRQAKSQYVEQQATRQPEPVMHVMPAVHARVVDQALPAGDRPRLLEIHPHPDEQFVGELVTQAGQAARVVHDRGKYGSGHLLTCPPGWWRISRQLRMPLPPPRGIRPARSPPTRWRRSRSAVLRRPPPLPL